MLAKDLAALIRPKDALVIMEELARTQEPAGEDALLALFEGMTIRWGLDTAYRYCMAQLTPTAADRLTAAIID